MKIHTPQDEYIDRKNGKFHLELFKKGFEGSPNSQVIAEFINQDVHILQVNKAFTEYYGYSQEEVIGENPRALNSGKMSLDFFVKMWDVILDPKIGFWRGEIINKRKNGKLINVILTINTIFDDKAKPRYFTAYHIDITDRKNAEEKLKESEVRYRIAYERANLYGDLVVHDINNILQVINSSLELSSLYINSPEKLNKINELNELSKKQIARGVKLISNAHKLSKIDDSEINLKKTNINNFLKEAIKYIKQSFQNKHIQVDTELGDVDLYIDANDLLLDVFENLLINSIRHSDNPNVEISVKVSKICENNKKLIKFEFKDNGRGISDERKETIFTRRKDFIKKTNGMGLGLSLVKKIISSYNGEIWMEDRVKGDYTKGSNFVFLIPEAL
jgi:PAS domain S-box-containing protein